MKLQGHPEGAPRNLSGFFIVIQEAGRLRGSEKLKANGLFALRARVEHFPLTACVVRLYSSRCDVDVVDERD